MSLLCGIDIGGTKLAAGLVTPEGELVRVGSTTDHTCLDEACLMDLAADLVRRLCGEVGIQPADLLGAAVGMAGHMRTRDGTVLTTSNLDGFKNYPLAAELSSRLGVKATLENDANCQAWAEYKYGAGRGHDDMVFVTVSTGIGAGIVIGGKLYRGRSGTAGEIGHTIVEPDNGLPCSCGNRGCFMAQASTINLDTVARESDARHGRAADPSVRADGKTIHARARDGDTAAQEVIDRYADYLGIMVYNIFQIFNPSAIVLGGGLMNWGTGYFERMRAKFHALAGGMLHDPLALAKAEAGEYSGVIGAAALLLEKD